MAKLSASESALLRFVPSIRELQFKAGGLDSAELGDALEAVELDAILLNTGHWMPLLYT